MVAFVKLPLSFEEQAQRLIDRGMSGDPGEIRERLAVVSYYRLSGYWHYCKGSDDRFRSGTSFAVVWDQYVFDRNLRLLAMDAIERVEVALRTLVSYHQAHVHGPFGYVDDPAALAGAGTGPKRQEFLRRVHDEVKRSKETYLQHFRTKYGDHHALPAVWIATEALSFGTVVTLWMQSSKGVRSEVARAFGVSEKVLQSWLWSLNEVRNVCAHHGRLWNRELGNKPIIPLRKHHPEWHEPVSFGNERVFAVLTICVDALARFAPGSAWPRRVRELVEQSPQAPLRNMGFPARWLDCPVWRSAR